MSICSHYYLFTREQLLTALQAHAATVAGEQGIEYATRAEIAVLAFLDGEAAQAHGLVVTGTNPQPSKSGISG